MRVLHSSILLVLCLFLHVSVQEWQIQPKEADNEIQERIKFSKYTIFPRTKWCGPGNKAKNPNDLGYFNITDACCREHDFCPDSIKAFRSKHNLWNSSIFLRSKCSCDNKFYKCLKNSTDEIASVIGNIYFNDIINPKCFELEHPITGCKTYEDVASNIFWTRKSRRFTNGSIFLTFDYIN
ncbi:phospholipase A2-like isoform X1 [Apis dorsata]|uniref:phospholipase A2-like isoform X1 n=1 Tax=Apis dorsata TaxID=7462 RepID=UPI001293D27A|nr:phospholipase A2-like isoform X1 [Apis dorsata]